MANPDMGHLDCPHCGAAMAAVRINKNKKLYIACGECQSMYTPHAPAAQERIKKAMKRIPVESPAPGEIPPVKKGFLDEFFTG